MIYFIGAGPGAVDLLTVRGAEILSRAGIIVYAGSLVNPELVQKYAPDCNGREIFWLIEESEWLERRKTYECRFTSF